MINQARKNKRIFIFDPCFGGLTGHWENYCKRLYNELIVRDYNVTVFGQSQYKENIVRGIAFKPVFEYQTFAPIKSYLDFQAHTDLLFANFSKIDVTQFQDDDIFIFHSIYPQTFYAIIAWTKLIAQHKAIISTLLFQFPTSAAKKNISSWQRIYLYLRKLFLRGQKYNNNLLEWVENNNVRYYQHNLTEVQHLVQQGSLILLANTDMLARNFSVLFKTKVYDLPMPGQKLNNYIKAPQVPSSPVNAQAKIIKIGYFGHSSLEKGGQFLQYLVEKTLAIYQNAHFIFHINPNPDTISHLGHFKNHQYPNLSCYHGHLPQEEMMALLREVDIILMPYSPLKYANTPSAIFTEGMPLKKIFIIPKHTWAHEEAKKYKTGYICFQDYTAQSILHALLKAIVKFDELMAKSEVAGEKFYKENNMVNYVDRFEQILHENKRMLQA